MDVLAEVDIGLETCMGMVAALRMVSHMPYSRPPAPRDASPCFWTRALACSPLCCYAWQAPSWCCHRL